MADRLSTAELIADLLRRGRIGQGLSPEDIERLNAIRGAAATPQDDGASNVGSNGSANPAAATFGVRVKLYSMKGTSLVPGGHEFFIFEPDFSYVGLCDFLGNNFRARQDGDARQRANLNHRVYWSEDHEVVSIKALWNPNYDEVWGVSDRGDSDNFTSLDQYNLASCMKVLKKQDIPTMSVVIRFVPPQDRARGGHA